MGHKKQKKHKCHKSDRNHLYEKVKLGILRPSSSNNVTAIEKKVIYNEKIKGISLLQNHPGKGLGIFTSTLTSSAPASIQNHYNCKPSNFQLFLGVILKKLQTKDDLNLFATPVTDEIAPLYSTMISHPMDFSTMKKKINQNLYHTLASFQDDFKLICDNAMIYNAPETIYYQRARRLWGHAEKIFLKKALIKLAKRYRGLSAVIENEFVKKSNAEVLDFKCADENMTVELVGTHPNLIESQQDCDMEKSTTMDIIPIRPTSIKNLQDSCVDTLKLVNKENVELSKTETIDEEELTAEQILASVDKAAKKVAHRLKYKRSHLSLLRPKNDETTTLNIISEVELDEVKEKTVTLGSLVGPLSDGISCLSPYKEPTENLVNLIDLVTTEPFSSFLPSMDSAFANLNQEETQLLESTYGEDDTRLQYTQSILSFAGENDLAKNMAERLLESLTDEQHPKTLHKLSDLQTNKDKEKNENESETEKETCYDIEVVDISSDDDEPEDKRSEFILNELQSVNPQDLASSIQSISLSNDNMELPELFYDKITIFINSQNQETTTEPTVTYLGDIV